MISRDRKKREPHQVVIDDSVEDFSQVDFESRPGRHFVHSGLEEHIEDMDTKYRRSDPDSELTANQRAYGKDEASGIFYSLGGDIK